MQQGRWRMPKKRTSMDKIKEVLRLKYECHLSLRKIASCTKVSRSTISEILTLFIAYCGPPFQLSIRRQEKFATLKSSWQHRALQTCRSLWKPKAGSLVRGIASSTSVVCLHYWSPIISRLLSPKPIVMSRSLMTVTASSPTTIKPQSWQHGHTSLKIRPRLKMQFLLSSVGSWCGYAMRSSIPSENLIWQLKNWCRH